MTGDNVIPAWVGDPVVAMGDMVVGGRLDGISTGDSEGGELITFPSEGDEVGSLVVPGTEIGEAEGSGGQNTVSAGIAWKKLASCKLS